MTAHSVPRPRHEPTLEVIDLHSFYGVSHVLHGVTLQAQAGELVALLGRNGAGKTTTMHSLVGVIRSERGQVLVDGTDVAGMAPHRRLGHGVSLVPSGARVFANLTVVENLAIVRGRRPDAGAEGWSVPRVFDQFPKLAELKSSFAGNLSGGERQMLAVGRALMGNPKVLLLDEPSEGLAPVVVQQVGTLLDTLRGAGLAIVLAEQNHRFALRHADRVFFIEKGLIRYESTPVELDGSEAMERYLGV